VELVVAEMLLYIAEQQPQAVLIVAVAVAVQVVVLAAVAVLQADQVL
jgi:hypothetical protein